MFSIGDLFRDTRTPEQKRKDKIRELWMCGVFFLIVLGVAALAVIGAITVIHEAIVHLH
jgi:hypothetical protein